MKLDCGNYVCNDKYSFLTDKVLEQNNHYSRKEIEEKLQTPTGLQPILIDGNKSDTIGHTDAYLSFIDNYRAVIPTYPSFPFLKDDIDFIDRPEKKVKECGIEVIKMYGAFRFIAFRKGNQSILSLYNSKVNYWDNQDGKIKKIAVKSGFFLKNCSPDKNRTCI